MVLEKKIMLEKMTYREVPEAVKESNGIVIIPCGVLEAHGPYLPVNVDTLYTVETVTRAANEVGVVVAPTIPYGNVKQQMGFPGSVHIRHKTLINLVKDIGHSLVQHGFNKLLVVNGHGGNIAPLDIACEELKYETGAITCNIAIWEMAVVPKPEGSPDIDAHGGAQEASLVMAISPEDVDMESAVVGKIVIDRPPNTALWSRMAGGVGAVHLFVDSREATEYGHIGDPAFASAERGERVLRAWTNGFVEILRFLKEDKLKFRSFDGDNR